MGASGYASQKVAQVLFTLNEMGCMPKTRLSFGSWRTLELPARSSLEWLLYQLDPKYGVGLLSNLSLRSVVLTTS